MHGDAALWTTGDYLAARNGDLLDVLVWMYGERNRDAKRTRPQPSPQPLARPGESPPTTTPERPPEKQRRRVETDHDTIMRFFGQSPTSQVEGRRDVAPRVPVGTAANPN